MWTAYLYNLHRQMLHVNRVSVEYYKFKFLICKQSVLETFAMSMYLF